MSPSLSIVQVKQGALLVLVPFLLLGCKPASKEAPAAPVAAEDPPRCILKSGPRRSGLLRRTPRSKRRLPHSSRKMTVEEKVGQVVQGDICCMKPADMKQYHLGSILAGGGSAPGNNERAPAKEWLALADEFYAASIDTSNGGVGIR
jgi:beta-glucosidase